MSTPPFIYISGYKFTRLEDVLSFRYSWKEKLKSQGLKGTILLSEEGININLSGTPLQIDFAKDLIRSHPEFKDIQFKESSADFHGFNRLLVKHKPFLIPFSCDIKRDKHVANYITPQQLKQWFDIGKEFLLIDTRNTYEYHIGTFEGATHLNIRHFKTFQKKWEDLNIDEKHPIVTFCTGGIRCEKAAPFLVQTGYPKVYQLEGGILNYFEKVGSAYWKGHCFVFDKRVSLDPQLRPSNIVQCFVCRSPVTPAEQEDSRYILEKSCPYCYQGKDTLFLDKNSLAFSKR